MSKPIRLAIITARNLKTSPSSNNTILRLLDNLSKEKYRLSILLVDDLIPKSHQTKLKKLKEVPTYQPFHLIKNHPKVSRCLNLTQLSLNQLKNKIDFAIIPIYNFFGEDGTLLGLLDSVGIPYLSPSMKTSAVCFDKKFCKAILKAHGILVSRDIEIRQKTFKLPTSFSFPLIVKPTSCGASFGACLATNSGELHQAVKKAFKFSTEVLIEEYIKGDEYSIGIIGHYTKPQALPVVMIKTINPFFDYEAKYYPNKVEEICPAPISNNLTKKLQLVAIKAYQAVKADSHARIDIICKDKNIYVLEINTFPGLLSQSIFPKELTAIGSSLSKFLDQTIQSKLSNS
jgi:D-alanine-D-alanine ligase